MSYFRNIQGEVGGATTWSPGGTYTFETFWRDSYVNEETSYYLNSIITGLYSDYPAQFNGSIFFPENYICPTDGWTNGPWAVDAVDDVVKSSGRITEGVYASAGGAWYEITLTIPADLPPGNYDICHLQVYAEPGGFYSFAKENYTITIGPRIELVSPVDDATDVRSKDTLKAEVIELGISTVSSVQLYLNTVKVYDGGPQGAKPYLQWMVGMYCQSDTEYDWYVTATIDDVVCTSEIWTFTTAEVQDLHPSFHWWGDTPVWGESPPAYDIYFGTVSGDLDLVVDDWTEPTWDWDEYPLDYDTDYYWRINDGPEYHFITTPLYPPQWQIKNLRLVAATNNKIWYEDI